MRDLYRKSMERLYLGCIVLSGVAMVVITLFIPAGVFMRYVMNDPLQWPEPASVIMMVFFSFIGGAAVYRANQQIAVEALMSGVVDGAENNEPTLFAQNHYQTPKGKVYSLTGHLIIPEIFVYSKVSWDKLPKGDQDLIRKLSREAQLEQRKLWDAYVQEATGKLKAAGVQFVKADKEAFYKATQPVRDKYGAKYAALIQRIRDTK